MSGIRPELSKKNPYHISKHRYYELKHFVMQYPEWSTYIKYAHTTTTLIPPEVRAIKRKGEYADPTAYSAIKMAQCDRNVDICNKALMAVYPDNPIIGNYILIAILENKSYDKMRAKYNIPISKDEWYQLYRKFFWLLDHAKSTNSYMK